MALFMQQSGNSPLGQFDVKDTDVASGALKGGELMSLTYGSLTNTSTETASFDARDAYCDISSVGYRAMTMIASDSNIGTGTGTKDGYTWYLADDGTANYGVLFGSVIGSGCGTTITGTNLGPASYVGSGKVTLWDKPGLYAVSLDAIEADTITGYPGTITATPTPGDGLYRSKNGKICKTGATNATVVGTETLNKIGLFVELTNSGGMVQTPARLFASGSPANPPSTTMYDRIVFQFFGTGHFGVA